MSNSQVPLLDVFFMLIENDEGKLQYESNYHSIAMRFVAKCMRTWPDKTTRKLFDKIIRRYLDEVPRQPGFNHDFLGYCCLYCPYASKDVVEEVIQLTCRYGMYNHAKSLAQEDCERNLTTDEVGALIEYYLKGCTYGSSTEKTLLALARLTDDESFYTEKKAAIDKRNRAYYHGG